MWPAEHRGYAGFISAVMDSPSFVFLRKQLQSNVTLGLELAGAILQRLYPTAAGAGQ